MTEFGKVEFSLTRTKYGLENWSFKWTGGDTCFVSEELVRERSPYIQSDLFDRVFYIGPYRLDVERFEHETKWFVCQRNPKHWHNRIVPKIYPLYVRWVEFWRWFRIFP